MGIKNALTVDLEEWFHLPDIEDKIPFKSWPMQENRIIRNVERLLELFNQRNVKATFFTLGWVAELYPQLIKSIVSNGHEIGTHGYKHSVVYKQTPKEFYESLSKSINIIESITQVKVKGHRAPFFSINENCLWAFEIMKECGIEYDSSLFSSSRKYGGTKLLLTQKNKPFRIITKKGSLIEFPMTMFNFLGKNIPVCGGGYLRILPYSVTYYGIKANNNRGLPSVIYIHPVDIDYQRPFIDMGLYQNFKSHFGLGRMLKRLDSLLFSFEFVTMESVISEYYL